MKNFVICFLVCVCVVLSSMISVEVIKDKFVEDAQNALLLESTDANNAAVSVKVMLKKDEKKEVSVSIQSKILDGTTLQTLSITAPVIDIGLTSSPEKTVSVPSMFKMFSSIIETLKTSMTTPKTITEPTKIGPDGRLAIKNEGRYFYLDPSMDAAVEEAQKDKDKKGLVWDDRFVGEKGEKLVMISSMAAEVPISENEIGTTTVPAVPVNLPIPKVATTKKSVTATKPKTTVVGVKQEVVVNTTNVEVRQEVVVNTTNVKDKIKALVVAPVKPTVYVYNPQGSKNNLTLYSVMGKKEEEIANIEPALVLPIEYSGLAVFKTKILGLLSNHFESKTEEFREGNWAWYYDVKRKKMVRTENLSVLPPPVAPAK